MMRSPFCGAAEMPQHMGLSSRGNREGALPLTGAAEVDGWERFVLAFVVGTEKGEDGIVGKLTDIALEIGSGLGALRHVVVTEDGRLKVVGLVHEGVEKLTRMGNGRDDHDGHTRPRDVIDEGTVGDVERLAGAGDFALGTAELTENRAELGEVGGEGIVVGEDAPVTGDVEVVANHRCFF